jgi:hypothetical protein
MKEFQELIQRGRQYNFIIGTGIDLKNWHSNDLADNLRINHSNMPDNGRL